MEREKRVVKQEIDEVMPRVKCSVRNCGFNNNGYCKDQTFAINITMWSTVNLRGETKNHPICMSYRSV